MITVEEYDQVEAQAIKALPVTHEQNVWGITPGIGDHPQILRTESFDGLVPLIERMHIPERFECVQFELGGLSNDDLARVAYAGRKVLDLQAQHMPKVDPVIPFSTLIATFAIWRKIKDGKPDAKTILEVGPGAGLTALYFAQDKDIEFYASIEATQTYYLLQSLVHDQAYGDDWYEAAKDYDQLVDADRAVHVPWWGVNDLYILPKSFDVITANACLNEMSDQALERYLKLFNTKCHENTMLMIQCVGAYLCRNIDQLRKVLTDFGWHLAAESIDYDVEKHFPSHYPHGSAFTTWWLTRKPSAKLAKSLLQPRSAPIVERHELLRLM